MTRDDVTDLLPDDEVRVVFYEPDYFDAAILGLTSDSPGWSMPPRVCYSAQKILEILQDQLDMAYEEACDYFCFNIQRFQTLDPPPPLLVWDWT